MVQKDVPAGFEEAVIRDFNTLAAVYRQRTSSFIFVSPIPFCGRAAPDETLNPKPSTLNPQPQTLNPQPQTTNLSTTNPPAEPPQAHAQTLKQRQTPADGELRV